MKDKNFYSLCRKLLVFIAVLLFYLGTWYSIGIYSSGTTGEILFFLVIYIISLLCNIHAILKIGELMCKEKEELNRIQTTAYTENEKVEYKNIPSASIALFDTVSREAEYQRNLVYIEIKSAIERCNYNCLIRHKLNDTLLSELEKLGYEIIRNENYITISWEKKDVPAETEEN